MDGRSRRPVVAGITPAPGAKLEPDAIGAAQDTIIGMASSAPAATVGLTLASLAATAAYGGGLILIGLAITGLVWVLSHHPGSVPITRGCSASPVSTARATPWRGSSDGAERPSRLPALALNASRH
jgi:hypothetical protein